METKGENKRERREEGRKTEEKEREREIEMIDFRRNEPLRDIMTLATAVTARKTHGHGGPGISVKLLTRSLTLWAAF